MAKRQYLEPAHAVIMRFAGEDGKMIDALKAVAEITGADQTRVYRWMRPAEQGGTGGLIPSQHARRLFEYARNNDMPIEAAEFLGGIRAA